MVQSSTPDADTYLTEVPDGREVVLARLRELCRVEPRGFMEVMAYGLPAYERGGVAEVAFASQKQYISLYIMRGDVRAAFAERPAGQDAGKGCPRFRKPDGVDLGLVRDLLRAAAAAPGPVC